MFIFSLVNVIGSSKQALILISLIVVITLVDSQFINVFYGTNFGTPGKLHLLLFVSLVILASVINTMLLLYVKRNDIQATTSRPLLLRVVYAAIEMLVFQEYNKAFSLLVTYFSHIWSAVTLWILSLTFMQWFSYTRSFSILIYGVYF